ncbi:hypothetical protein CHARACLAT_032055 [Characodon lateralis]|uniref:Uncharacterized protein n=1 Tax=Characodon lateralis TaxID=208331 RepID=A0ABU7DBT8_9TELE|nr:hypothetical protein [Characodon lateralis]
MTVERVSAEKSECLQRMEQWAMQERLEAEKRQMSLVSELKSWFLSKLQNMEDHFIGDSGTKLQHSSSLADNLNEADGASNTVLPAELWCSPQLTELQKEHGLLGSCQAEPSRVEGGSANNYFVVHVENSPGDGSATCSTDVHRTSFMFISSASKDEVGKFRCKLSLQSTNVKNLRVLVTDYR